MTDSFRLLQDQLRVDRRLRPLGSGDGVDEGVVPTFGRRRAGKFEPGVVPPHRRQRAVRHPRQQLQRRADDDDVADAQPSQSTQKRRFRRRTAADILVNFYLFRNYDP